MKIEDLKVIINSDLSAKIKKSEIIRTLAKDKDVIPVVMKMLEFERLDKKELIEDMNLELSRAHIYIDERPQIKNESKAAFNKSFVIDSISAFYIKYKAVVTHCFNRFNN